APSQRGESEPASADRVGGHASYDPATQRQLLEIDLQEAENELNLAKVELAEYQKIQKTSPGTLSAHDFRRKEAEVRQAELRLKRIKILLDAVAAKENAVPRSPLSAVEEAVVPPKNLPERIWETLGLTLEPIDEDAFDGLKSAFRGGLMVNDVRPDSPADERGIRQGDILVGLGRWETASLDNVAYVLARDDASQAGGITFHILRDGKAMVGRLSVADADLSPGPASASPAVSETSRDKATRIRLAEIDLREAQLELQGLSKEYSRIAELSKQGTVQQSEVDRVLLKKQQAELAVERAQIVLDGLKSPSPTLPRK
ncbi:MAG TPA: PDZ domain-containing protein, partial [Pirellulaceae bacterium]|nr:PDZ domain-containing protein [Pirellulaceae bacterium]